MDKYLDAQNDSFNGNTVNLYNEYAVGNTQPAPLRNAIPNGPIATSVRLACALRYFAGGSPYDIMVRYGISHTDIFICVWCVVDAINRLAEFCILFPQAHDKQMEIAEGFKAVSQAGFDNCVGAIDGILIWIHKPSYSESKRCGVGQKKFFCGRKGKFGLN